MAELNGTLQLRTWENQPHLIAAQVQNDLLCYQVPLPLGDQNPAQLLLPPGNYQLRVVAGDKTTPWKKIQLESGHTLAYKAEWDLCLSTILWGVLIFILFGVFFLIAGPGAKLGIKGLVALTGIQMSKRRLYLQQDW
jgi:hypothetical protein